MVMVLNKEDSVDWKECDKWEDLPDGTWLTKDDTERKPYNITTVTSKTGDGHKMVIVGNQFSWDIGKLIAYVAFQKYDGRKELDVDEFYQNEDL